MSLIVDEDSPQAVGAVLLTMLLVFGAAIAIAHCEPHTVTLHGRLFTQGDPSECSYFLDPEGTSQSVTISAASSDYLCDYLQGSANRGTFTIVLEPE